jgi:CBS domain containing-hemolysin-like protein
MSDDSAIIDATMSIPDFNEQFRADIPESNDYETIAGYLQKVTGKLPELHEEIRAGTFIFTILSKQGRRLHQVKVRRSPQPTG